MIKKITFVGLLLGASAFSTASFAESINDLSSIAGDRTNQLQGYGLVSGLQGTGDRGSQFTNQSLQSLIEKYGIKVPDGVNLNSRNSAFVMVQGKIGSFDGVGKAIDVTVSSVGSSSSLRGGTLSSTALRGLDGDVYAVASGPIVVDGISAEGMDGSSLTVNTTGVGYIPGGGTIEKEVPNNVEDEESIILNLHDRNYSTNANIVKKINTVFGSGTAKSVSPSTIEVITPKDPTARVSFISMINELDVERGESEAMVVVNSRTGTVAISGNVTLRPAAISVGSMVINISEGQEASQAAPFGGETKIVNNSQVTITSTSNKFAMADSSATLQDLAQVLNSVGTGASDMVHILELLKKSGSLNAKIVVI